MSRKSWETIQDTWFNRVKYLAYWIILHSFYKFYQITKTGDSVMETRSLQGRCLDFVDTWDFQHKLPETFGLKPNSETSSDNRGNND